MSENQAGQFLLGFIQDTINLKVLIADYNTSYINFKAIYASKIPQAEWEKRKEELISELPEAERRAFLAMLNNIRRLAFSVYTDVISLEKDLALTDKEKESFEEAYTEIETKALFDYKRCKDFVQILNNIKVKHLNMKALIINDEKERQAIEAMQTPKGF